MKININTKYNIGDTVYVADHYYDFYPISTPGIIENILIDGDINKIRIDYIIQQDIFTVSVPEEWVFPSYAECTKWCEEHNKTSYTLPS